MNAKRMLWIGAIGSVIAALCCFTPLLAILFGALGRRGPVAGPGGICRADACRGDQGPAGVMTELVSTLTCPECGARHREEMPTDACIWFYDCPSCSARLKPRKGDCCVFCSYGDVPCPPVQEDGKGCCQ